VGTRDRRRAPPGRLRPLHEFHPTFLYEAIWNLSLAPRLSGLGAGKTIRPPGLFALYVAGYSLGRIGEELLRVDPAHHILGLRLNFFVASALCVTGLAWFARTQWPGSRRRLRRGGALLAAGAAIFLTGCAHGGTGSGADESSAATRLIPQQPDIRLSLINHTERRAIVYHGFSDRSRL